MIYNMLIVGFGGFLGSAARYLAVVAVSRNVWASSFPYGTLFVNVLGCLVIGFLGGLAINKQFLTEYTRLFLFTGVLGGFTTFSAFSLDTFYLMRTDQWSSAILNVVLQLVLGLGATALGYLIAKSC